MVWVHLSFCSNSRLRRKQLLQCASVRTQIQWVTCWFHVFLHITLPHLGAVFSGLRCCVLGTMASSSEQLPPALAGVVCTPLLLRTCLWEVPIFIFEGLSLGASWELGCATELSGGKSHLTNMLYKTHEVLLGYCADSIQTCEGWQVPWGKDTVSEKISQICHNLPE